MKMKLLIILIISMSHVSFAKAKYAAIVTEINNISKSSELASSFELGLNDTGSIIKGLKIGFDGANKINHLVVGTHHGNEVDSADVPVELAKQILAILEDAGHPLFAKFSQFKFTIIPVLNVYGYNRRNREERDEHGKSHDPNRDYPDPCADKENFKLKSTGLIAKYLKDNNVIAAITVHGYIGTLTFPWGIYTTDYRTDDHEDFTAWTTEAVKHNGYRVGTHGGLIYPAAGAFEDWAYNELGVWSSLLEVERNLNLKNDAKTLVEYFNQVPSERSKSHGHTASCAKIFNSKSMPLSRP
jgi:hypothetical protein